MFRIRPLTPWLLVTIAACTVVDPPEDVTTIHVLNASAFDFDSLVVEDWVVGSLSAGRSAGPREFDAIFRNVFVRIRIGERVFIQQPIDHVGDEPLASGQFTFSLDVLDLDGPQFGGVVVTVTEGVQAVTN